MPAWVRSALVTFATTFALAVAASGFEWSQPALIAAAVAAARTAVSALIPGGGFGVAPDSLPVTVELDRELPDENAVELPYGEDDL